MLQPVDAELLALAGQRRLVGAGQREERREVDPLGEVLGELEAGPRRGPVGIDGVIQQPEAVLVAHLLVLAADLGDLAHVERQPQAIQRRTPQLALGHRPAQHGQRIGLLGLVAGALIGDVGRGRGALVQEGLFAGTGGADLEDGLWRVSASWRCLRAWWRRSARGSAGRPGSRTRLKAASASLRSVAEDLATGPASLLIWASSLTAESASSSRLNALSAAPAAVRPSASVAQITVARTKPIMMGSLPRTSAA